MKNNVKVQDETQSLQSCVSVSDLRIGNLMEYYIDADNLGWQIYSVDWEDIRLCKDKNESFNKDNRPIKITEELLLKIGAIKLDFKDFPSFNLFGTQINFVNGLWIEYVSRVEIKGLNHLQNIFFFRNSEELQISFLTEH
jgi:hypothetical protein